MRMYDLIQKKKIGEELSDQEIAFFIKGYTEGEIPDYQASALCMAIWFSGMSDKETLTLTQCMAHSGDTVDLSCFGKFSVDKHSTGGVGDKTSLIIAPIVASLGGKVAKMSGRGLGHTGGTIDKLEAIPGFCTSLTSEELIAQVQQIGVAIVGQTENMALADKKLYALRDVTATVDSIPLIVSSVMSKKLAAGAHTIVLDVKAGSGAFMKTTEDAEKLAEGMVRIGKSCGRRMAALITNMDVPLGEAVGNTLEVKEAIDLLRGKKEGDLKEVCVALATEMVALFKEISPEEAEKEVLGALSSGAAYAKMKEWIVAQGGDSAYIDCPALFEEAAIVSSLYAEEEGYIGRMDAEKIGTAAAILGAGRISKADTIDHSAGIILKKKTGDYVKKGDLLCRMHTNKRTALSEAEALYRSALVLTKERPPKKPLIYKILR